MNAQGSLFVTPQARTVRVLICALNGSTADASRNDPTLRRMMAFAEREGAVTVGEHSAVISPCGHYRYSLRRGSLCVVNMYGWRSTEPSDLAALDQTTRIGPDNDAAIEAGARDADICIAAWGSSFPRDGGADRARDQRATEQAEGALRSARRIVHLALAAVLKVEIDDLDAREDLQVEQWGGDATAPIVLCAKVYAGPDLDGWRCLTREEWERAAAAGVAMGPWSGDTIIHHSEPGARERMTTALTSLRDGDAAKFNGIEATRASDLFWRFIDRSDGSTFTLDIVTAVDLVLEEPLPDVMRLMDMLLGVLDVGRGADFEEIVGPVDHPDPQPGLLPRIIARWSEKEKREAAAWAAERHTSAAPTPTHVGRLCIAGTYRIDLVQLRAEMDDAGSDPGAGKPHT